MQNESLKNEMLSQLVKINRISENLKSSLESDIQFLNQDGYRKTLLNMNNAMADFISSISRA